MCGIIGITGDKVNPEKSINMLKRLEYRGYDSAGIAVNTEKDIKIEKGKGRIKEAIKKEKIPVEKPKTVIAHSRWSTHGEPSEKNAHPHTDCTEEIATVHNGIIHNHSEIKRKLKEKGHVFTSKTDTEVIPHLIEEKMKKRTRNKENILKTIKEIKEEIEGEYAVVISIKGKKELYGFKKDSPLCIGINTDKEENYFSSDIYSFSHLTNQSIALEDGEKALITPRGYEIYNGSLQKIKRKPEKFEWNQEKTKKEEEHHMLSEIKEQPEAVKRLLKKQDEEGLGRLTQLMKNHEKTVITASGTSYHASLFGAHLLQDSGQETQAIIASEYQNYIKPDKNTLTIGVSQSGETMDVVKALQHAEEKNSTTASIVNVPKTTIPRKTQNSVKIHAGQEISVASTKTFTNQVTTFARIANNLGEERNVRKLPIKSKKTIEKNEERIKDLSKQLKEEKDIYIIGEGPTYPIAREIALKLKEIPYIHAEGMMAGELKHGTLALIEEKTPVISLRTNDKMLKTEEEVKSKGARIIPISTETKLKIPEGNKVEKAVCSNIIGQLLSYYIAKERNCPIDKPKNLAKVISVT